MSELLTPQAIEAPTPPLLVNGGGAPPPVESHSTVMDRQNRLPRYVAGALLAGAAILTSNLAPQEHPKAEATPAFVIPPAHPLPERGQVVYPPINKAATDFAQDILHAPENPDIKHAEADLLQTVQQAEPLGPVRLDKRRFLTPFEKDIALFSVEQKVADEMGLTVHNPEPYLAPLRDDLYPQNGSQGQASLPFEVYFNAAKEYLHKFGISARVSNDTEELAFHQHSPTPEGLETPRAKESMFNIIRAFGRMPKEYVRDVAGTNEIILTAGSGPVAFTQSNDPHGHRKIWFNMSNLSTRPVVFHEIFHDADNAMGGGWEATDTGDTAYNAINTGATYGKHSNARTVTAFWREVHDKYVEKQDLRLKNNMSGACSVQAKLQNMKEQATTLSLADAYSRNNIVEDKAVIGANIPDQYGPVDMLDPTTPRIVRKFTLLYSRLAYYAPRVAFFFSKTSQRGDEQTIQTRETYFEPDCIIPVTGSK
ncbi:MAG TPA: hypothetical protein VMY99_04965 [Nevskiaceae bacterium]|nr:hypothetical protein [Nevskiaceae bacterium]